jgi:hypothetical protein
VYELCFHLPRCLVVACGGSYFPHFDSTSKYPAVLVTDANASRGRPSLPVHAKDVPIVLGHHKGNVANTLNKEKNPNHQATHFAGMMHFAGTWYFGSLFFGNSLAFFILV